ncbi:PhoX family protein [Streptomyces albidoflavus]|uniref:PhoX family protein n=1 Tax=Streptomyces sp. BI87 TaxID=2987521 RepID=UPI002221D239|nr:PhoX family protein [Streptomyces sp. BI87]UYX93128.1 PhoX family protein [Streptomyces sp. BI87]
MERRTFLRTTVVGTSAVALGGSLWAGTAHAAPAQPGPGPYGPVGSADAQGIRLPAGFRSRIVARTGQRVAGTSYTWHPAPDGGACYADGSGWIYVSNSEVSPDGGAGAIRFSSSGDITGAYRILSGTRTNCAGGSTPWQTWLSCEEVDRGYVYETDPWGVKAAVRRDAMGRFKHEAAAADPVRKVIYLTEDVFDGCFYRFIPTTWGDLSAGRLEVLRMGSGTSGAVTWAAVPDPSGAATATRNQVSGAKRFNGGEGCHYADDTCWFTTKGDNRVWRYDAVAQRLDLTYDDSLVTGGAAPLTGVDNVTGNSSGDLYVAEDGGSMDICLITPDDVVTPFLRIERQSASEITGPAFSPDGTRLYFSSQRGTSGSSSGGITYEVTGPFRR